MAIEGAKAPKRKKAQDSKKHNPIKKKTKRKGSSRNPNLIPLGGIPLLAQKKKKEKKEKASESGGEISLVSTAPAAQQLRFFLHHFQSANRFKLSPLELEAFKGEECHLFSTTKVAPKLFPIIRCSLGEIEKEPDQWVSSDKKMDPSPLCQPINEYTCMVELSHSMDQDVDNFSEHMKATFESSWKDVLCDGKLLEGKVDSGSPVIIVISTSALRSLELLRGLKPLTRECRPAKLFAKHMKVEDQVALLKGRVNIACGTPSRIKKLIDLDALLLSRVEVIVLDMQRDAKGYSLFTLPQVSTEFWDLYKDHFNERLLQGRSRICFYGPVPHAEISKICESDD